MKQGILLLLPWSVCPSFNHPSLSNSRNQKHIPFIVSGALESANQEGLLTARERRQLRNERRKSKADYNWREEVEERLSKKPKKQYQSWTDEPILDNLAKMGPQWWVVQVSRVKSQYTVERLARSFSLKFPDLDFQVYIPSVQIKRKLKSGKFSVKPKPLFPGNAFVRCMMNREIHNFIKDYEGIGGFIGSKVGNSKQYMTKPRPVEEENMKAIFRAEKEEQEKADKAFEEAEQQIKEAKKEKENKPLGADHNILVPGSTIQLVSGSFSGFSGILKKLDKNAQLATIGLTLFGKETLVHVDVKDIATGEV
ncbi:unnamed protein product [Cuscuta epithymum]|uniref:NusG-like N-terminal domain-containing protein n=1 Tax=Cuscuta epithymum TaxID=186058 RepID=A0AAV0F5C7_9ASTE|nr:unnamed protein product [Cuscuta epithymum]